MAVSVRAAYSMPGLHCLDFDLSPKNQFDSGARWGNSSPVLILSLLEIVEQDSIHVQEASRRLQPGWVRNVCAAFEKGVAFSEYESHQNSQNSIYCQSNDVQNLSSKKLNPQNEVKSRLPKAKSLESLDSCHKKFPKKAKVPLPKARHKACIEAACVVCKRSLAYQEDKSKSQNNYQSASSKRLPDELPAYEKNEVLPTIKLPKGSKLEEGSRVLQIDSTSQGGVKLDGQSNEVSSPLKVPFESQCSNEAKSDLANEVTAIASNPEKCQLYNRHELLLEGTPPLGPSIVSNQSLRDLSGVLGAPNGSVLEVAQMGVSTVIPQLYEQEQNDASSSNDLLCQAQMKVQLQDDRSIPSHLVVNSHGAKTTQPLDPDEIPSVRPKAKLISAVALEQDVDKSITRSETDTTFKNCTVHHGYAQVAVNVKSFSIPAKARSKLGAADSEKENESVQAQCEIVESATDIHVRGVTHHSLESDPLKSQKCHNFAISGRKKDNTEHCETTNNQSHVLDSSSGRTITLANMHHYPPDRLETFLLIKDNYENSFPISWDNFFVHFNSSKQVVTPRQRFCAKLALSFEDEKDQSDNMKTLKKALAKKWSRWDGSVEERRQRLSIFTLGSLRFQLLCHPLVSYDISELEESESDSEEEMLEALTPFRHVPTYVIAKIFCFLKTKDLAALKCTCKDFYWLINQFDITGTDSQWMIGKEYRMDPCMHCGKIQDPRGDVSLCQRHPKAFYKYSVINRQYWTCCNAVKETTEGCEIGLHNNRWTTSKFQPNFIRKPWKSQSWYITANSERWCDKEHL